MDEKKIQKFLEWLPTKFEEFKGKSLEEVAEDLNRLYETDEGKQTIQTLMNTFLEEQDKDPSKFANGGILPTSKLDYIVSLHKKGGKLKTKKCSCGCEMHKVLENGGVVEKCACGCDTKKIVKAENGTKTKSKSKSKVETYQKGYLTPWTFAFNSAKTTVLPNIDGGGQRTIQRVASPSGKVIDRIYAPGQGYTERVITPTDTTFTRVISNGGSGAPDIQTFSKGMPDFNWFQQRWKQYGVYKKGGKA